MCHMYQLFIIHHKLLYFVGGKKSRISKETFAGRSDNYKMSEDTLLHRKLSKFNCLHSMQFNNINYIHCRREKYAVLFKSDNI